MSASSPDEAAEDLEDYEKKMGRFTLQQLEAIAAYLTFMKKEYPDRWAEYIDSAIKCIQQLIEEKKASE